jgi:hypothetical protein
MMQRIGRENSVSCVHWRFSTDGSLNRKMGERIPLELELTAYLPNVAI